MKAQKPRKIMAIGAHPDDVEFAMGGTLAKLHHGGHQVQIVDITNGEPTPHGSVETRMKEAAASAKILGAERFTLDLPNRKLFDTVEAREKIAEHIRLFQPDIIFSHYPVDAHPDHWAASDLAMASRFYGKLSHTSMKGERHFTPRIFYFFAVHLRSSPAPSFTLNISGFIDQKVEALLSYQSQFRELGHKPGKKPKEINRTNRTNSIEEFVKTQNRYWGQRSGVAYAEPFYSPEILALNQIGDLAL